MTIPKITPYSGGVANPDGSQTQTEFTQNMFDQLSYEAELSTELNNTVDGINDTATQVDSDATSAAQSAAAAEAAASGLNYQGLWPDSGGSANKGDTYQTQAGGTPTGQYFTALQNTTVDPVGDDVNWRAVNGFTQTFDNVAEMVTSRPPIGSKVNVLGYHRAFDGGHAYWSVKELDDEVVNGWSVIHPEGASYIFVLNVFSGISSLAFGVVFDNSTPTADAYESASNYMGMKQLKLCHPSGVAIIEREVTITGDITQSGSESGKSYTTGTSLYLGDNHINVIGNSPTFMNMSFSGTDETVGYNIKLYTNDPESDQNVDALFENCTLFFAGTLVFCEGRGVTFNNCLFSLYRSCLEIDWPIPFNPPALLEQSLEYGMRGYSFNNCRWHASPGVILKNVGYNKDNARGINITGYSDTSQGIIDGSMRDFSVDVNILYGGQPVMLIGSTHKVKNGKVSGTLSGEKDSGQFDIGISNILTMAGDAVIEDVEFDVIARDVKGTAYVLQGEVSNLKIGGVYKDIMKQNGESGHGTRYLVDRVGGTINGVVEVSAVVDIPDHVNNPSYLINGLSDTELRQGLVSKPDYIGVTGGSIRGRIGNISRHTYTGDGTANRQMSLPDEAQYVLVCGAQPNANQGKAGIAIDVAFGGTGDVVMPNSKTLQVTDDFNILNDVYIYTVHY